MTLQPFYALALAIPVFAAPSFGQSCMTADGFEEDDTCTTATNFNGELCQFGLTIQPFDEDFFGTTVQPGEKIYADAIGHDSGADIDMVLRSGCGMILALDNGNSSEAHIEWVNNSPVPVTITIEVAMTTLGTATCSFYDVSSTVVLNTAGCGPDAFEPNNCCDMAAELSEGQHSGTLQSGNDDWYSITINSGRTLEIHATTSENLQLFLWEDCFATAVENSPSRVRATNEQPGSKTYLLQVFSTSPANECFDYQLFVDVLQGFENFCRGDGGNGMGCTDCPCGNNTGGGNGGCLNGAGQSALLAPAGFSSVSIPTLNFRLFGGNPNTLAVLLSGDNRAPGNVANPCFGLGTGGLAASFDGLRCTVGAIQRHGNRPTDASGNVGVTNNRWGPPNAPVAGLIAQGGFVAGQTRYFQAVYRELPTLMCGTGLNTSQGVHVIIFP